MIAFESSQENLTCLRSNLELKQIMDKVIIVETAVSDIDGDVTFDNSDNGATKRISSTGTTVVPSVSLDKYLNGMDVDLIKIDVEGYEPLVLSGCWKTIQSSLPTLFVEYSLPLVSAAGLSWEGVGHRLVQIYGGSTILGVSGTETSRDFVILRNESRLLNLMFQKS